MSDAWFRFSSAEWFRQSAGLSAVERGVYITLIALVDARGGPIDKNDRRLAAHCGATVQSFRKALNSLVALGNIEIIDGKIGLSFIENCIRKSGRESVSPSLKAEIIERDGGACVYCGTSSGSFHIDHVHPWSRGGRTEVSNLALACAPCNLSKGDKTVEEWRK